MATHGRLALAISVLLVAGCAKAVPLPERRLPEVPVAAKEQPRWLTPEEREACDRAAKSRIGGFVHHIPEICRKAEYNALGWSALIAFIKRIWSQFTYNQG